MKLKNKITLMVTGLIIMVIALMSIYSVREMNGKIRSKVEDSLTDLAISLSSNPIIIENIGKSKGEALISKYAKQIRLETEVSFIIVTDMDKIRYSHPEPDRVGRPFSNSDIDEAIIDGAIYTKEGIGPMGMTVKAFAPIYRDGNQVGVVVVGTLKENILQEYWEFMIKLLPVIILIGTGGYFTAKGLASNIKRIIYGLEPEEIARLLKEREVIFNHITDGMIAINQNGMITMINQTAKEILQLQTDVTRIEQLNPQLKETFEQLLIDEVPILNMEQKLNKQITILSNYTVIKEKELRIGAVLTFKNMTDLSVLIEELAGIKKLNCDLRAQNHEFMNKLHTIAGLIQLEESDEALRYITTISDQRIEIMTVLENIKELSISALLLGKYTRASESKINMVIDPNSHLLSVPTGMNAIELGCVIGNLIENSIEVLKGQADAKLEVSIIQEEQLVIQIKNNGPKIKDDEFEAIFKRGFSTKGENRGYGLFHVRQIVLGVSGEIQVESTEVATHWVVKI